MSEDSRKIMANPIIQEQDATPLQEQENIIVSVPEPDPLCIDTDDPTTIEATGSDNRSMRLYSVLPIAFTLGFVVFAILFLNEVLITPYRIKESIQKADNLYRSASTLEQQDNASHRTTHGQDSKALEVIGTPTGTEDKTVPALNRDNQGILPQFMELLKVNEDVKGWITVPETNIDYVVLQSDGDNPEYYLTRDIERKEIKAGSLFLDAKCSIENNSQNLTIHGHNMTSTDNMFHYLVKFKELNYYKERPILTFDTIYQTGQWKIFAIFITNGSSEKEAFFDYTRPSFTDSEDFLNFVYQLKIRSLFNIDTVDINENDQLLTLSTCSYEVKNYRTVIVARRVREKEAPTVDIEQVTVNPEPLYPDSFYYRYGGKAPKLTHTFREAQRLGEINWYRTDKE
jgi:sortase B